MIAPLRSEPTYVVTIAVGLLNCEKDELQLTSKAIEAIQLYVNSVGLCVTVTNTTFIYTGGREPGLLVGLINYPRFPSTQEQINQHAINLATRLREILHQKRISIIMPDRTVTIGDV